MSDDKLCYEGTPIASYRVVDLKAILDKHGLSKSGTKAELTARLSSYVLSVDEAKRRSADDDEDNQMSIGLDDGDSADQPPPEEAPAQKSADKRRSSRRSEVVEDTSALDSPSKRRSSRRRGTETSEPADEEPSEGDSTPTPVGTPLVVPKLSLRGRFSSPSTSVNDDSSPAPPTVFPQKGNESSADDDPEEEDDDEEEEQESADSSSSSRRKHKKRRDRSEEKRERRERKKEEKERRRRDRVSSGDRSVEPEKDPEGAERGRKPSAEHEGDHVKPTPVVEPPVVKESYPVLSKKEQEEQQPSKPAKSKEEQKEEKASPEKRQEAKKPKEDTPVAGPVGTPEKKPAVPQRSPDKKPEEPKEKEKKPEEPKEKEKKPEETKEKEVKVKSADVPAPAPAGKEEVVAPAPEKPAVQVTEEGVLEKRYKTKEGASIVVKIPEKRVEESRKIRLKRSSEVRSGDKEENNVENKERVKPDNLAEKIEMKINDVLPTTAASVVVGSAEVLPKATKVSEGGDDGKKEVKTSSRPRIEPPKSGGGDAGRGIENEKKKPEIRRSSPSKEVRARPERRRISPPRKDEDSKDSGHSETRTDSAESQQKNERHRTSPPEKVGSSRISRRESGHKKPVEPKPEIPEPAAEKKLEKKEPSDEEIVPKAEAPASKARPPTRKLNLKRKAPEELAAASGAAEDSHEDQKKRRGWGSTGIASRKANVEIDIETLKNLVVHDPKSETAEADEADEKEPSLAVTAVGDDGGVRRKRTVSASAAGSRDVSSEDLDNAEGEQAEEGEEKPEGGEGNLKEKLVRRIRVKSGADDSVLARTENGESEDPGDLRRRISIDVQGDAPRRVTVKLDAAPVRGGRAPTPARNPPSRVIYIRNLVRPFTVVQLKDLLSRTGSLEPDMFWTDRIKSQCIACFETEEQAVETRVALHGVKWPFSNPKSLRVDFTTEAELREHMARDEQSAAGAGAGARPVSAAETDASGRARRDSNEKPRRVGDWERKQSPLKMEDVARKRHSRSRSLDVDAKRRRLDERGRRGSRSPGRGVREWDRDKVGEKSPGARERERDAKRRERIREDGRDKDRDEKAKTPPNALDVLFRKTKATPSIYWLPLTDEQIARKEEERKLRVLQRQRRLAEVDKKQDKRRSRSRSASRDRFRGRVRRYP